MTVFQSIFLGIVQGLTEFLPISSSAHLVLIPELFGWERVIPFSFFVLVQVATLLGVIVYFWRDLVNIILAVFSGIIHKRPFEAYEARLGWLILLASLPAGVFGLIAKSKVEAVFGSPVITAIFLYVTALLLFVAERIGKRTREMIEVNWKDASWMGLFQALAIFPGISRSGATISGGMLRNFDRTGAARFSFLMSIPIMLAAGLLETYGIIRDASLAGLLPVYLPGLITSAVVGYLSIRWLLKFLYRSPLYVFSIYCVIFASVCLLVFFLR
jgi:undecaprenyl-diphosphatase